MSKLSIAAKAQNVAYPAYIAASLVNEVSTDSINIDFIDEKVVNSSNVSLDDVADQEKVLLTLASKYPSILPSASESQEWITFSLSKLYVKNFKELSADLETLNSHLNLRSFFLGSTFSLADLSIWSVLRANGLMVSIIKNEIYINLSRWFNYLSNYLESYIESYVKLVNELRKSSKLAANNGKKETHKANFEINLPGAVMGQVVTRFPPEPSGYLHIGHAKAAVLNEYFAHAYKGKLIIRFDDTNPSKEKDEFQQSIIEDLKLLGVVGDLVSHSSDYFVQMYDLAVKLIKQGDAYVDNTPQEKMREQRMVGDPSEKRDTSIEENLEIFEKMKNGDESALNYCLRAKMDYQAPNKALRDPVIYRSNSTPHHRTGTEWKMYPTYDFCAPVVDALEGVTHALRTNEYRDRNPQYEWFLKKLNLRHVEIWDFARVNFVRTLLSKRKLQWFVDKQYVPNWDDPRFPTVRGVRRRGMTVEGLRNFIIAQGPSRNIINLDWSIIWALNKKVIDPIAPRFTALEHPVVVNLADGPTEAKSEDKPKHKKNPDVGNKAVIFFNKVLVEHEDALTFADNEEVTFMDWGNVIIDKVHKDGEKVTSIDAHLHLEGDFRKTSKKVTWLADTKDKVDVELVDFDHLITKDKLEEGDDFENFLTPKTEFRSTAVADLNIRDLKEGDVIQFERKGYYRVDTPYADGQTPVLFTIPDGKATSKYGSK